jgi:hypothetical protein
MAKKWIGKAIKRPGRETERAKRSGVSTHEQMEQDSHSSNASLRAAGNLGLRLSGMNKGGAKKRSWYGSKST